MRLQSPEARAVFKARVVEAASTLFYERGIAATGVDAITAAAGVSKRTIYEQFGNKDAIVTGYVEYAGRRALQTYLFDAPKECSPQEEILAVFQRICDRSASIEVRGCPIVNACAELPRTAEARVAAIDNKNELLAFFTSRVRAAGADPATAEATAEQLTMLFDGAMAWGGVRSSAVPKSLLDAATKLLGALGTNQPPPVQHESAPRHSPRQSAAGN